MNVYELTKSTHAGVKSDLTKQWNGKPKGVPTHGIMPVFMGKESEKVSLAESGILLTDFGESFVPSTTLRYRSNSPPHPAGPPRSLLFA